MSLLVAAQAYHAAGASIIPCATDASKRPLVSEWKAFQQSRPSLEQIETWFSLNGRSIGVLSGVVSGGREGIDIDNKTAPGYPNAEDLLNDLHELIEADRPGLFDRLAIEGSPSQGAHLLYRCTVIEGNQKLALRPATDNDREQANNLKLDRVTMIETRGEGGYFISAPSPGYWVIQGDVYNPPHITPDERTTLLRAARALNLLQADSTPTPRPEITAIDGARPGDVYNERTSTQDVARMLEGAGWKVVMQRKDGTILLRRPGKRHGWSATLGYAGTDLLHIFSTNAHPFEDQESYRPFSVYTYLEHDGDFTLAARELARQGYGAPHIQVVTDQWVADAIADRHDDQPSLWLDLPRVGYLDPALGADASPWLDGYLEYSRHWSPRSFDGFHEAIGMWMLSTVAARRVVVHLGKPQHTPLLIALAGRSTVHAKTTAAELGIDLMQAAGLDWLLADDNATPQKFVRDRTQVPPDNYDRLTGTDKYLADLRLMFAGQCGWWYDEFGMLLHAMTRSGGVMNDFSGLLRKFDDCAPRYVYGTIGRPTDRVVSPYLALLASLTPADLRPLMRKGNAGWSDGFWARWIFVTPPASEMKSDPFPRGERRAPTALVGALRDFHDRLGLPTFYMQEKEIQVGPLPTLVCSITESAEAAHYRYNDAMRELVMSGDAEDFDAWHGRLANKALRVATLLAAFEHDGQIELRHWAKAQQMAERWRGSLYRLYEQTNKREASEKKNAEDVVLGVIERLRLATIREIGQRIRWMSAAEVQETIEKLSKAGMVEPVQTGRTIRFRMRLEGEDT